MSASPVSDTCGFAAPSGQACGKPATLTAVMASDLTKSRLFYGGRCESCAWLKGAQNARILYLEPLNQAKHINDWRY